MARIINILSGEQRELFMQHTFGRDPVTSSTHLNDSYVSRSHAVITWGGDKWQLKDISRNGTFLNGQRIVPKENYQLKIDDKISFGAEDAEIWQLLDDSEPKTMLVPREGGEEILLKEFHSLPSKEDPQIFLYASDGRWVCETESHCHWLESGDVVGTQEKKWRFVEAIPLAETEYIGQSQKADRHEITFRFEASQNEEHVFLKVLIEAKEIDLDERVHHYVMMELARRRLTDLEAGVEKEEQGWIGRKEFAAMIGLDDTNHLNMQLFRFRKQLHKALPDIDEINNVLQVRRNEIRFYADRVEIAGGLPLMN